MSDGLSLVLDELKNIVHKKSCDTDTNAILEGYLEEFHVGGAIALCKVDSI